MLYLNHNKFYLGEKVQFIHRVLLIPFTRTIAFLNFKKFLKKIRKDKYLFYQVTNKSAPLIYKARF